MNHAVGRALLVGAAGENPRAVEHDVRRMAEMLDRRRFEVDVRTGPRATRAGILSGYDDLIAASRPTQPAVFYYSGHGFRTIADDEARIWQGICPTDIHASTAMDFRGISAWELSIKQAQLTERTRNVTVILDCCYAGQMSRGDDLLDAMPKALPDPLQVGIRAHLDALRAHYGAALDAVHALSNPDAVRVIACGPHQSAFDYRDLQGQYRSAFTDALLDVMNGVEGVPISWAAIGDAIRRRVLDRFPTQRPDIEGPARRRLFSLHEDEPGDVTTITVRGDTLRIGAGALVGVSRGDVYAVMPAGSRAYRPGDAIAEVTISETFATFSHAASHSLTGQAALPLDAVAIPIERAAARWPVRIDVPEQARAIVDAAVQATRMLECVTPDHATAIATLRLDDDALTIEDQLGPLFPPARFPRDLSHTVKNLANLGAARALRELEGPHGVSERDLEIEWGIVQRGERCRMPDHGSLLGTRNKIYVRVKNNSQAPRYLHIFNVGLRGKVSLLTRYAPAGLLLTAKEPEHTLGRRPDGELLGLPLSWPAGLPRGPHPRLDEVVVIVTATRASLQGLETVEHISTARSAGSKLQARLAQVQDGRGRSVRSPEPVDGYLMKRLSYFLHHDDAVVPAIPVAVDERVG